MFNHLTHTELLMIAVPAILFVLVVEMVRRRQLREDYSLLWLVTFGVLVILSIFSDSLLFKIADLMGIFYPPAALFVIGFGLLLLVLLQFSTVITQLSKQNKQAAQRIALLSARIHELERKLEVQEKG